MDIDSVFNRHPSFNKSDEPLQFHTVHGDNLILSDDDFTATRRDETDSMINGAAFSSRPVRVNEQICLHIKDISNKKLGVICIGFTSRNPNTLGDEPPIRNYPDAYLPGFWPVRLEKSWYKKDDILHYHVDEPGTLHFGINFIQKGTFYLNVAVYAFLDILGYSTSLTFVNDIIEGNISLISPRNLTMPRFNRDLIPFELHTTKGDNIRFLLSYEVVAKLSYELNNSCVFSLSPMSSEQVIIVQILSMRPGNEWLPIGVTTCDPSTLNPNDLFGDIEDIACSENWLLFKNDVNVLQIGDELAIRLTKEGYVVLARNNEEPVIMECTNITERVWLFVKLRGSIEIIKTFTPRPKEDGSANTTE